jgi:hypothetical protein
LLGDSVKTKAARTREIGDIGNVIIRRGIVRAADTRNAAAWAYPFGIAGFDPDKVKEK